MTNRTDNFNRAAGSIGTPSDFGSSWVQQSGSWVIGSVGPEANRALLNDGAGLASCVLESSVADVTVQVTLPNVPVAPDVGLVVRAADDNNYLYAAFYGTNIGLVKLWKREAGAFTLLAQASYSGITSGAVVKVVANGSSVTLYKDGASVLSATATTFQTNTKHGILANGDVATSFDDFSITAFVATPTSHAATGALSASAATVSATATHTATTHAATAALAASAATATGTATHTSASSATITTVALRNNTGTLLAITTIDKVVALRLSDATVAATWASQTTNGSGILTLTANGLVPAIDYLLVTSNTAGSAVGVRKYTAA